MQRLPKLDIRRDVGTMHPGRDKPAADSPHTMGDLKRALPEGLGPMKCRRRVFGGSSFFSRVSGTWNAPCLFSSRRSLLLARHQREFRSRRLTDAASRRGRGRATRHLSGRPTDMEPRGPCGRYGRGGLTMCMMVTTWEMWLAQIKVAGAAENAVFVDGYIFMFSSPRLASLSSSSPSSSLVLPGVCEHCSL